MVLTTVAGLEIVRSREGCGFRPICHVTSLILWSLFHEHLERILKFILAKNMREVLPRKGSCCVFICFYFPPVYVRIQGQELASSLCRRYETEKVALQRRTPILRASEIFRVLRTAHEFLYFQSGNG